MICNWDYIRAVYICSGCLKDRQKCTCKREEIKTWEEKQAENKKAYKITKKENQ